ncbi:SDR family NAD(P)-dependent oxidoreductase [Alicyclobacillus acidoterrestris]|uniref:SDR family oxidoreductase n=1 Tax=Alicyclobacillus acidoterrestris (strain ATCC 49025 / DSM 3922 / CIP 106132 / NCIMB 13137 / GD3B) TaxID=1356854 RepID=T0D9G7_ALIAG|nr:SDR family NAD(P)-dependent oxidoreductase [Alicyclobacillus acidoterrestris]EPZ48097.1 short-chain dehydrogenase [Alicyclobacillus acidoterrestris ATCC 49025]UNO48636.1 SDR family oxidoreductase [Alicyclobacillus acidoterrestris]
MRFQGQVAIVTGGAGGIGQASARLLASQGARVIVADLDATAGEAVAAEIREAGYVATFHPVDVSVYEQVEALVRFAVDTYGQLDIMFNNAGIFGDGSQNVIDLPIDVYKRMISINQDGVFYGIKAAAAVMKERGGVIINTASIYAYIADKNQLPYHASKAAVVGMTKASALELGRYNIRVVAIAPGMIDTGLIDAWREDERVWNTIQKAHMRRKLGTAEQVANVVAFLASDEASFLNGHAYFVDDGAASFKR